MAPNENKPIIRVLRGETLTPPPLWLMRQAGRYLPEYLDIRAKAANFLKFCYSPHLAVGAALQPLQRYGVDAVILFSDILVIPDSLGQKVTFTSDQGPLLQPIHSANDLAKLSLDAALNHLTPIFQILNSLSKKIPQQTALIGFAGAPWTTATYMVEGGSSKNYEIVRNWAYRDATGFGKLIDILVDITAAYLIEQIKAGAELLQLFDSWAGLLPEEQFDRWVIVPTQRIIEKVRIAYPDIPIIGFPRGAGVLYARFVKETGVNAISIDHTIPLDWAAQTLQPHCTVQGNLDSFLLAIGGEMMETAVNRILDIMSHGPFIFNLGHGVMPCTPPQNITRLVEIVRAWK